MDNLEKIDKFLERYSLTTLNQEEIENVNRPITSMKLKPWFKTSQQIEVQDRMASQVNFTKHLGEN